MIDLWYRRVIFTDLLRQLYGRIKDAGLCPAKGRDGDKHMEGSLHYLGLADDPVIYDKDGKWLDSYETYLPYGLWWEAQHPDARWGGRFLNPDGSPGRDANHFSLTYQGKS